jgi:tetratricopeptide (TPR) repeat protein
VIVDSPVVGASRLVDEKAMATRSGSMSSAARALARLLIVLILPGLVVVAQPLGVWSTPLAGLALVGLVLIGVAVVVRYPVSDDQLYQAYGAWRESRWSEAEGAMADVIAVVRRRPGRNARRVLVDAQLKRAWALRQLDRAGEAIDCCNSVIELSRRRADAEGREYVVLATMTKAWALGRNGQSVESAMAYQLVFDRNRDASEAGLRELAACALNELGFSQAENGNCEGALASCSRVIGAFENDRELKGSVAKALYNRARLLARLGRWRAAAKDFDLLIDRYGNDPERSLDVAMALVDKGEALAKADERDLAVGCFNLAMERFHTHEDVLVRRQAAMAAERLGAVFNLEGDFSRALKSYERVEQLVDTCSDMAIAALANRAGLLARLGRVRESRAVMEDARRRLRSCASPSSNRQAFVEQIEEVLASAELDAAPGR